jgi:hypothetical protein
MLTSSTGVTDGTWCVGDFFRIASVESVPDRPIISRRKTGPVAPSKFSKGSAALNCSYVFEPEGDALADLGTVLPDENRIFGGARLGPLSELAEDISVVRDWARDTWIADAPDQRERCAAPTTAGPFTLTF